MRGLIKGKPQELIKREPTIDLVFKFGIGVDPEPFLKKHALKDKQRRVCISAFTACPHGIMSHQDLLNAIPLDGIIELVHQF